MVTLLSEVDRVIPDNDPPILTVTSPLTTANGGMLSGAIPVDVSVVDASTIAEIRIRLDGTTHTVVNETATLATALDTSAMADGPTRNAAVLHISG